MTTTEGRREDIPAAFSRAVSYFDFVSFANASNPTPSGGGMTSGHVESRTLLTKYIPRKNWQLSAIAAL
ncbi:MAG: hypothetical protein NVV74_01995 [Magnetospirillum sp.]|nr:hypothetical protein [Magnetospirillum sp.]